MSLSLPENLSPKWLIIKMLVYLDTQHERVYPPALERVSFFCFASSFDQGSCLNRKVKNSFFSFCVNSSVKKPEPVLIPAIRSVQKGFSYTGRRTSSEVSAVPPAPQHRSVVLMSLLIAMKEPPLAAIFKLSNSL